MKLRFVLFAPNPDQFHPCHQNFLDSLHAAIMASDFTPDQFHNLELEPCCFARIVEEAFSGSEAINLDYSLGHTLIIDYSNVSQERLDEEVEKAKASV